MSKFIEYATKLIQYCENRDMDKLNALLSEAEEYFLFTKEFDKIIRMYLEVQTQMEYIGNMDLLVEYLIRFLIFYEDLGIETGRDHYLSSQGHLNFIVGDYESAMESAKLALIEAEKNNNIITRIVIHSNMAMLYIKMNDYEHALKKVQEANLLFDKDIMENWYFEGSIMMTHAECLINLNKCDEAKALLDKVAKNDSYHDSILEQMEHNHVSAQYYYKIGEYEKSLESYKQAISVAEKHNIVFEYEHMYLGIAKALFKLEYIEDSEIYKEKADDITKDTLEKANLSIMHKVNLSIEIEEKINRAKRKQQSEDATKKLNLSKYDELTEVLTKDYLFKQLNESFLEIEDKDLPSLLEITINNIKDVIDKSSPIFGDKYVYEVVKYLRKNIEDYIIGRTSDNKFMIVFSATDALIIEDEIKWLLTNLKNTSLTIKGEQYDIKFSYKIIDLEKYKNENKLPKLDMYTIIRE